MASHPHPTPRTPRHIGTYASYVHPKHRYPPLIGTYIPRHLPNVLPPALQSGQGSKQGKNRVTKKERGTGYDA